MIILNKETYTSKYGSVKILVKSKVKGQIMKIINLNLKVITIIMTMLTFNSLDQLTT